MKLYKVSSVITGTFLLLLVLMMVLRYGFLVDIELLGPEGFLALTPRDLLTGINLSIVILTVHGWFYVLYLFADFRMWSIMRWSFTRFLIIAAGGVVPFLSFIVEHRYHRLASDQLAELETPVEATA
jgi:integral membrane protein